MYAIAHICRLSNPRANAGKRARDLVFLSMFLSGSSDLPRTAIFDITVSTFLRGIYDGFEFGECLAR